MSASRRLVAAIVVVTALTAGAGVGVRLAACSNACISDLGRDYQNRGIRPDALPYVKANFEYPVGTGFVFWAATLVADTARSFFTVTSLAALVLAVLIAWGLVRRYGRRAWYFALAPPLALYGSANWDLFALAPAVAGLLAFERRRDTQAGVLLGVGAAMKLFPGLFVLPLAANRLRAGDRRGALRVLCWSAGMFALVNVPVLVASPNGWLYQLRFQSRRTPTWGSLWHYVLRTPALHLWVSRAAAPKIGNVGGIVMIAAGMAAITCLAWQNRLGPIAASAAATGLFLLSNKVYSPQYDLWLVPFFVMLAVPARDYVGYVLADIGVFVLVFGSLGHHFGWTTGWAYTMLVLVVVRAAAIVLLVRDGARADSPDASDGPSTRPRRVPMILDVLRTRAAVALALLIALVTAVPAAADPAPAPPAVPPAPSSTTAPPGPDPTPMIRIASLSGQARSADSALAGATARRAQVGAELADAQSALAQAVAVTSSLNVAAADAEARYAASRAELDRIAAFTYMQGGSSSALDILTASDPLDASRQQLLLSRADDARQRIVEQTRADHADAIRAAQQAEQERVRRRARVNALEQAVPGADAAVADARTKADGAHRRLNRWLSVAGGTNTPILGPPALTATDLAAWFSATRNPPNTTVSIDDLAALFISEGDDEGVRGDIAFAQSIVETGSFSYPAGGQVNGTDNNFAGIGACDSCPHGHIYPDARTGVRVQMQYLHVYADSKITVARFAHPPVDPNMDQNFRKGQAPTWAGLTHTWATADGYADSILRVYYEILDWVTAHDH